MRELRYLFPKTLGSSVRAVLTLYFVSTKSKCQNKRTKLNLNLWSCELCPKVKTIFVTYFADLFKTLELKLIGGYDEVSGKGSVLSRRILTFFATHQLSFNLKLCCLGPANTRGSAGRTEPIVGGVVVDVKTANSHAANFNRTFVDSLPEDVIMTLMLGPSLIKKPFKLREMILAKEDQGFSKSRSSNWEWMKYIFAIKKY